ncbi:MAG: MMPL family transporter [Candidatus Acetothermia bacterium]|jgi:predicted RND superfamily exporter protein|nr:MMPL family transporter [Candidatus Acetothermia bacterium]MDH7504615.1 MMPL family transporter [Candidatus Acetothermia bacterium]
MSERLFLSVYRFVRDRAKWVLLGAFSLAFLAFLYTFVISGLTVRSSFLDLLPRDDPLIARFRETQEALERVDYLQILVRLKSPPADVGERRRTLLEASSRLIAQLRASPEIVEASDRPEVALPEVLILAGGQEQLQELLSYVERIEARLPAGGAAPAGSERLSEVYGQINAALEAAISGEGSGGGEFDPDQLKQTALELRGLTLGVTEMVALLDQPEGLEGDIAGLISSLDELQQRAEEQVFFSQDSAAILINARPRFSSQAGGVSYAHEVVRTVREAVRAAGLDSARFTVGLAGSYATAAEGDLLIKGDMGKATIFSAIGIVLILLLAFKQLLLPLLAIIPLLLALVLTLGWAQLATAGLNLITAFLPALIMGLGIDYGAHFLTRYLEERRAGRPGGPAWEKTLQMKGPAVAVAGLTTAIVLLSLLSSRSRGIFEMGVIGAVGILLALLLFIFLLPSLAIVCQGLFGQGLLGQLRQRQLLPWGKLLSWLLKRKRAVVLSIIVLSLVLIYPASQVRLRFVSQTLLPQEMESQLVQRAIQEGGFNLEQLKLGDYFIFYARDAEELQRVATRLREVPLVEGVQSLADYLSPEFQAYGLEGVSFSAGLAAAGRQLELVRTNLGEREAIRAEAERLVINLSSLQALSALYGQGEIAATLSSLIQGLLGLIDSLEHLDPERIAAHIEALGEELARLEAKIREAFPKGDPFTLAWGLLQEWFRTAKGEFIIYAKVDSSKIYQPEYYRQFIAQVSQFSQVFFGAAMIQDRLEQHMKRDFWVTTLISSLLILALLLWNFRRRGQRRFALLAVLPLLLGYLWMLAGMRLLGLNFNFTNMIISPLLIGMGIGYGVYIIHRYLEEDDVQRATASTALAVLVSATTTMVSFGSLLLARTPGLRFLGQSALLGLGFNAIFNLVLLPAVIALRKD